MIQIVYSNKNCLDVFKLFIQCNKEFTTLPLYVISDFDVNDYNVSGHYQYNNNQPYWQVWREALINFKSDYFIYLQEDFFLYDTVKENELEKYKNFLIENPKYSFIRLLKSGQLKNNKVNENLFEIEPTNPNIFSMQATIWKSSDYIKLMEAVQDPKWLETPLYRDKMIELNMWGLYHFDNEPKVGDAHHDSIVYPYIATAVVKGKWNISEYQDKLNKILTENNINLKERGCC